MSEAQEVVLDLGSDGKLAVLAETIGGPEFVSDETVTAKLENITGPITRMGRETLEALKAASPHKATVEIGFGLAVEEGQLISLLAKGRGEATIKVTLEWSAAPA